MPSRPDRQLHSGNITLITKWILQRSMQLNFQLAFCEISCQRAVTTSSRDSCRHVLRIPGSPIPPIPNMFAVPERSWSDFRTEHAVLR